MPIITVRPWRTTAHGRGVVSHGRGVVWHGRGVASRGRGVVSRGRCVVARDRGFLPPRRGGRTILSVKTANPLKCQPGGNALGGTDRIVRPPHGIMRLPPPKSGGNPLTTNDLLPRGDRLLDLADFFLVLVRRFGDGGFGGFHGFGFVAVRGFESRLEVEVVDVLLDGEGLVEPGLGVGHVLRIEGERRGAEGGAPVGGRR